MAETRGDLVPYLAAQILKRLPYHCSITYHFRPPPAIFNRLPPPVPRAIKQSNYPHLSQPPPTPQMSGSTSIRGKVTGIVSHTSASGVSSLVRLGGPTARQQAQGQRLLMLIRSEQRVNPTGSQGDAFTDCMTPRPHLKPSQRLTNSSVATRRSVT